MANRFSNSNSSSIDLPRIGITIGEAAGIGPEITLKAVADEEIRICCRPIIIGDLRFLAKTASVLGLDLNFIESSRHSDQIPGRPLTQAVLTAVPVIDLKNLPDEVIYGEVSEETGKASGEYVEAAVDLWRDGKVDAIATAPINKRSLSLGGYSYSGHTEFLAALTDTKKFSMSFFADNLRVVLLLTHVSLMRAIELVKKESLIDLIQFSEEQLSRLLKKKVRLAVAGLNPHASEGGMFGNEETDEIEPAIFYCRENLGIDVSGPFSPDTIFLRGYKGEFDAVIACYHDQATIAVKSLSFGTAVNVTLGLPMIRTSVDHGTAFDIAGKGVADESSMKAAIKLAAKLQRQK